MVEFDNAKDALKDAFELAKAKSITTEGRTITVKEMQELFEERLCNIADLLGLEDIYLKQEMEV